MRTPGPYNIVEYANLIDLHSIAVNPLRIGSGTGLFTKALLAHPAWTKNIKAYVAVEPSEGMRETFSQTIQDDRICLQDGTFQNTKVEDGWADLVVIAQV